MVLRASGKAMLKSDSNWDIRAGIVVLRRTVRLERVRRRRIAWKWYG